MYTQPSGIDPFLIPASSWGQGHRSLLEPVYPSCPRLKAGWRPGQVASSFQGHMQTNIHTHINTYRQWRLSDFCAFSLFVVQYYLLWSAKIGGEQPQIKIWIIWTVKPFFVSVSFARIFVSSYIDSGNSFPVSAQISILSFLRVAAYMVLSGVIILPPAGSNIWCMISGLQSCKYFVTKIRAAAPLG